MAAVIPAGDGELAAPEAFAGLRGLDPRAPAGASALGFDPRRPRAALAPFAPRAVLIHDAARPFLARRHIDALLAALEHADSCFVPVLPGGRHAQAA